MAAKNSSHHFNNAVKRISQETKESNDKWYRDNPGKTPGWNDNYTWKTLSRQRYGHSQAYLDGYDKIDWSKG